MGTLWKLAIALMGVGALSACTRGLLEPDYSKHLCHIAVEEKFETATPLHPQELNGGDAAIGGAVGTLPWSILVPPLLPLGAVVVAPIAALLEAGTGIECVAAMVKYPNAQTEFQEILMAVDSNSLKRALEKALNAPSDRCARPSNGSAALATDAIVEIKKIGVTMTCAFGKRKYWIDVKWRATSPTGKPLFRDTTTSCVQTSLWGVGEWSTNRDRAREEMERVLSKTGQHMAVELLSEERRFECAFRSVETGEIEEVRQRR